MPHFHTSKEVISERYEFRPVFERQKMKNWLMKMACGEILRNSVAVCAMRNDIFDFCSARLLFSSFQMPKFA